MNFRFFCQHSFGKKIVVTCAKIMGKLGKKWDFYCGRKKLFQHHDLMIVAVLRHSNFAQHKGCVAPNSSFIVVVLLRYYIVKAQELLGDEACSVAVNDPRLLLQKLFPDGFVPTIIVPSLMETRVPSTFQTLTYQCDAY